MDQDQIKQTILKDRAIRRELTRQSHQWFFAIFLGHHIRYSAAPFHQEMLGLTESEKHKITAVMAFRSSAKSTIMNTSYALWSIFGKQQKKCILIMSGTHHQARIHFMNIRNELHLNQLLRNDLGPYKIEDETGSSLSLFLPRMGGRIFAVSSEQSIRGIRNGPHRPDLIICDDIEDTVSTVYSRERTSVYDWFKREVIPAGGPKAKIVVLGNLVHEDSLLMNLARNIRNGAMDGVFRAYPIQDDDNRILWPGRFPDVKSIREFKKEVGDEETWKREYLLALPDEGQDPKFMEENAEFFKRHNLFESLLGKIHYPSDSPMRGFSISAPFQEESAMRTWLRGIYGELKMMQNDGPKIIPKKYRAKES